MIIFGLDLRRNQPIPRDRNVHLTFGHVFAEGFFPSFEIDRTGEGRQHHELSERHAAVLRPIGSVASNVSSRSVGSPKMNDPSTCTPCSVKRLEPLNQSVARKIEILEHRLQSFGRHRLDSHQGASNLRLSHGVQEVGIFGGFHGDLCVKGQVARKLARRSISSNRSARMALSVLSFSWLPCFSASFMSVSVTG